MRYHIASHRMASHRGEVLHTASSEERRSPIHFVLAIPDWNVSTYSRELLVELMLLIQCTDRRGCSTEDEERNFAAPRTGIVASIFSQVDFRHCFVDTLTLQDTRAVMSHA